MFSVLELCIHIHLTPLKRTQRYTRKKIRAVLLLCMSAPSHDFLEDNIVDVISNTGALLTTASVPVSRYLCHPFCERVSECVSVHPRVRPRLIPH